MNFQMPEKSLISDILRLHEGFPTFPVYEVFFPESPNFGFYLNPNDEKIITYEPMMLSQPQPGFRQPKIVYVSNPNHYFQVSLEDEGESLGFQKVNDETLQNHLNSIFNGKTRRILQSSESQKRIPSSILDLEEILDFLNK